ncbi:peptidylprolyl isomerase [Leucobacter sp. wl10]|uniref:peptidylprolyl isomerase n=1 Tax=Leucobacter sp. wl10 TaxID=2304677 RepID=UPI000E5B7AC8|nr:peptidylprolyl isomerase [Leucobacter sp. wl10]RGE18074.1 peptidylprolyl isomerase [Leucobacter sp. wl10]
MLRRLVPATAAAVLLLAGVTGCSAQQSAAADCEPRLKPGVLSDTVTVQGAFGEAPQVSVPKQTEILTSQRTVVESAEDRTDVASEGSLVGVNMAFFDSASGNQLYASPGFSQAKGSPEFLMIDRKNSNPLSEAVRCTSPGDRVVLAMSPKESAQLGAQLRSTSTAPIVGVIDTVSAGPLTARGSVRGLPSGYPAVVTNEKGRPGVVLPPRDAPAGTSSAVRIAGDGAKVAASDNVIAQVLSVGWDGQEQTNSWDTGVMALGAEDQVAQSGFTFRGELTGKTVGSQVVVIDRPQGGDARVVVVDIVGVG